ncbi:MAG: hypothetical protein OEM05_03600 [Myxococcales bacterium]|nr:hypothetical protein [Myxococcales bacterium]
MLRLLRLTTAVAVATFAAGPVTAATLDWNGTFSLEFGTVAPIVNQGLGVATVNGSSSLGHLSTLRIAGGITGATTIALTDPDTASLVSLRATAQLGTGTLSGISGGPPLAGNVLPVGGVVRICIISPGCVVSLPVPLTVSGTRGLGIGGLVTVNTFSPGGGLKVSAVAAPWTLGVAAVTGIPTVSGGFSTVTAQGFVHGPASATSSTATSAGSGVIQVVTPVSVTTTLPAPSDVLALLGILKLHFLPEPGVILLLGSGVAGLVVIGRHRMRP